VRTLAISHQRDAGPGVFAEAVSAAGDELDVWHVAESNDPPADPLGYDAVLTFGGTPGLRLRSHCSASCLKPTCRCWASASARSC
jgi:hypothetical protein